MTKSEQLARVPPLYRLARSLRDRQHLRHDARTREKRAVIVDTARTHGLRVLVETGTYTGESAWAFRAQFDRIETIEIEPTLVRLARIRFGRTPNVHVHEGDSATVLPQILERIDVPSLFWLDAHPSTDRAARDAPVPLLAEIAAIAAHPVRGHVVLIDDLRLMGTPGFPALEQLALPGYELETIGDVGRLQPTRS